MNVTTTEAIDFIDLISDTVTLPTDEMRHAIANARLGDDVYGEDPTVTALEQVGAELLKKNAAVLLPTGTMGNLAALMAHCQRGAAVILGDESDIYCYELGGASVVGGLAFHPLQTTKDGRLELDEVKGALRCDEYGDQRPQPGVLCLESPHNRRGGVVLPLEYMEEVHRFTTAQGLPLHLDGARIFNAACALKVEAYRIATYCDS